MGNCCCAAPNKLPGKENGEDGDSLKFVITASPPSCQPVTEKKAAEPKQLLKPTKKPVSPQKVETRRDTNEDRAQPSGLDFE